MKRFFSELAAIVMALLRKLVSVKVCAFAVGNYFGGRDGRAFGGYIRAVGGISTDPADHILYRESVSEMAVWDDPGQRGQRCCLTFRKA